MTDKSEIVLALDVMGTDAGPGSIIAGGVEAAREFGTGIKIILVGLTDTIKNELKRFTNLPPNLDIHHAGDEIRMTDAPSDALRRKESSIAESFRMHKDGEVDAVISAGNTGAVMSTAVLRLGRLKEVKRPGIASFFPTVGGGQSIVLDVGANSICKPINLYQFAIMGSIFANYMMKIKKPRVRLLSIGEEEVKGNELTISTYPLLKNNKALNFVGNAEGRDILKGKADVFVADGFVGNILLKFAESIEDFLTTSLKRQVSTNIFSRFGSMLMYPFLRRLRNTFDYAEYGGAPLLGVNGVCIICHGDSSARAIYRALAVARDMVSHQVNRKIEAVLTAGQNGEKEAVDYNINGASISN